MNKVILSARYPQFAARLKALGYDILTSENIPCDMPYERDHADLQCLILDDTAFVLKRCQQLMTALSRDYHIIPCGDRFGGRYPDNVCLNALCLQNRLICRVSSLDDHVKKYCNTHGYGLINVNQGYTKCSCAVISDNAIITSDRSIIKALENTAINILPIGQGSVKLDGAKYGFIGGASGYDKDTHTVYFCGNIKLHPDYGNIHRFCREHGTKIVSLTTEELTDTGGIIVC